jgi:hypothetical protein
MQKKKWSKKYRGIAGCTLHLAEPRSILALQQWRSATRPRKMGSTRFRVWKKLAELLGLASFLEYWCQPLLFWLFSKIKYVTLTFELYLKILYLNSYFSDSFFKFEILTPTSPNFFTFQPLWTFFSKFTQIQREYLKSTTLAIYFSDSRENLLMCPSRPVATFSCLSITHSHPSALNCSMAGRIQSRHRPFIVDRFVSNRHPQLHQPPNCRCQTTDRDMTTDGVMTRLRPSRIEWWVITLMDRIVLIICWSCSPHFDTTTTIRFSHHP